MVAHEHHTIALSKNQKLVLDVLSESQKPLSAYSILDDLRGDGFRAPLQVYRALEKLLEFGMVHRIESMNAFIACSQSSCDLASMTAFAICDRCETVSEVKDMALSDCLAAIARQSGFKSNRSNIELHGLCVRCDDA
jgi:Fur family transcriptional regulator, zinc uptake regulator